MQMKLGVPWQSLDFKRRQKLCPANKIDMHIHISEAAATSEVSRGEDTKEKPCSSGLHMSKIEKSDPVNV